MAGPASPGTEGPTFEPPNLPPGWIAQWDSSSKKYYYVQLSTGVSQWEIPTEAAHGGTPAHGAEHPYGVPAQPELITHPDGTQTIKHADGSLEPINPPDSNRGGLDGQAGERGLGSFATNALLNQLGGKQSHGGGQSSGGLGGLAGQVLGGLSGGGHSSSGGSHGSSNPAGKLVGALAQSIFSSGSSKPEQPQNYHGGQSAQPQHSGGFAGSVMGEVAHLFGGQSHAQQNFGYSNSGQSASYSGQAPPASYQASNTSTPSHNAPPSSQHNAPSHNPPAGQPAGTPSFPPPPGQHGAPSYASASAGFGQHQTSYANAPSTQQPHGSFYPQGPSSHAHSPAPQGQGQQYPQQASYGSPFPNQQHQTQYVGQQQYPPPPSTYDPPYTNVPPPPPGGPPGGPQSFPGHASYQSGQPSAPPVPSNTHPHYGQQSNQGYSSNW